MHTVITLRAANARRLRVAERRAEDATKHLAELEQVVHLPLSLLCASLRLSLLCASAPIAPLCFSAPIPSFCAVSAMRSNRVMRTRARLLGCRALPYDRVSVRLVNGAVGPKLMTFTSC